MSRSRLSTVFFFSFLTTVFALQWWQRSSYPPWLWILLFGVGLAGILALRKDRWRKGALLLIAVIIGCSIAFLTVAHAIQETHRSALPKLADLGTMTIHGRIVENPNTFPRRADYTVAVDRAQTASGRIIEAQGTLLVTDHNEWPPHAYGDDILAKGTVQRLADLQNPSYEHYLRAQGIDALMTAMNIRTIAFVRGSSVFASLYRLRSALEANIIRLYPEPHASLLEGLLIGDRNTIPQIVTDAFKTTGLTHILAISGYNITVILSVLGSLLFWMPLRWRFVPSILILIAFTLLVGAEASVVRACIMGILGLLAIQAERMQSARLTVLTTLFLMLAWNPLQLWYDAGFQLSFLALIGVMELQPILNDCLKKVPAFAGIRDVLIMTIAAQLIASPWIVFLFGQFSLIAPLANLLAAPVVPLAMLFGTVSVIAGMVSTILGQMIAAIGWVFLGWIVETPMLLSQIPMAALKLRHVATIGIVLYYGGLVCVIVAVRRRRKGE
ncbi:ComEC family competence protein [Candidatus Peregrinibacteria bacterium]|nr:ComEC family competence protein [Candidatus Peregrinibacteria bacterium]MBI3816163.1 ComEC family competence protein [Candidatus Peregrinibacteria bacterium]